MNTQPSPQRTIKSTCKPIRTKFLALSIGLSVAALSLLCSHSAMAATYSMTSGDGSGTTSFNAAGKWSSGAAPAATHDYVTSFQLRSPTTPGAYTFAGDSLTINSGGILQGKMTNSGTLAFTNGTGLFLNGGMLLQANSADNFILTVLGTITANASTTTFLGATTNVGPTCETLDIAGTIGGSGNLIIGGTANAGANNGVVKLDAANTVSGTVSVVTPTGTGKNVIGHATDRFLALNNLNALQNATLELTGGSSLADLVSFSSASNTGTYNIGALSGGANQALTDTASAAVAISVGSNNASTAYSGVLSGGGSLTKVGNGTMTLGGANSYTGDTTINAGTLELGASGSLASTSNVNINAGAIFDTTAGTFTMLGTKTFKFTLDPAGVGSAGLLDAASLDITAADVDFTLAGALDDAAYVIAEYTSLAGTQFANVSNLPGGYMIDYGYNGGSQIAVVTIPEPGAFAMLLGGLGAMLTFQRRRSRAVR